MLKLAGLVGIDAVATVGAAVGATAVPPQEDTGVVEVLVEAEVQEDTILGLILAPGLGLNLALTQGLGRLPTLLGLRTVQDAD